MTITLVRQHVNAPRASVYRALLDAGAVARWKVPAGMTSQVHAFDPREGGSFRVSLTYDAPTGSGKTTAHTDTYHGRFAKLVPDEQVVEVIEFEGSGAPSGSSRVVRGRGRSTSEGGMSPRVHPLVSRFAEARLPLELASGPIVSRGGSGTAEIVQLDIARAADRRRRGERFRAWLGHPENRVEVQGTDRALAQLVLLVHEPRREFVLEIPRTAGVPFGARIVREAGQRRWVRSSTTDRKRHFLCGMDEQHLFIALLPEPVSTVRAAHEALRDPRVAAAERGAPGAAVRQGEWFFVPLSAAEARDVEAEVGRGLHVRRKVGIAQAAGIRRIGRPHVADEVFVSQARRGADGSLRVYVRGAVRHPDHRTIELRGWWAVVPNREALEQAIEGVSWVD